MSIDGLRTWMVKHVPRWLWPISPYGDKGRQDMPERHDAANDLTALSMRVDRLTRLEAEARWRAFRAEHEGQHE